MTHEKQAASAFGVTALVAFVAAANFLLHSPTASADDAHIEWRKRTITSQSAQLGTKDYYMVTGGSLPAEAYFPREICGIRGLNAAVYKASEQDLRSLLRSLESKPLLLVVVGDMKIDIDQVPVVRIEDSTDLQQLASEINVAASRRFNRAGCNTS
ncbi:hypothetical protein [Tardiphaga sp. 285_C5_N1_2]|uniref:hypothetical protein n=1 Tax=Tardiphaga sp. 285_C5_N1_2 TaxID=3240775 RepID=UPI003F898832